MKSFYSNGFEIHIIDICLTDLTVIIYPACKNMYLFFMLVPICVSGLCMSADQRKSSNEYMGVN